MPISTDLLTNSNNSGPPVVKDSEFPFARATIKNKGDNTYEVPDSFNISSIVDEGIGALECNFITPVANVDYTISHAVQPIKFGTIVQVDPDQEPTTGSFHLIASVIPEPPATQRPKPVDFKRLFVTVYGQRIV